MERLLVHRALALLYSKMGALPQAVSSYDERELLAIELGIHEEVKRAAQEKEDACQRLEQETQSQLRSWYDALIAPVEDRLPPGSKITIVPDEALHSLPFAIFRDKEGKYLLEKRTISMVSSLEVLKRIHELSGQRPKPSVEALVVGDPQENLNQAESEARRLSKQLGGSLLQGKEATISKVEESVRQARVLHFACHGNRSRKTHPNSIFEGALGFAASEGEGWWHADQIQELNLSADLAVLSACASGRGKLQREGVVGLTRSFLAAGVPTVVATQWSLPDTKETVELMETFYQHVLGKRALSKEKQLDKAEALRWAMLETLNKPGLRNRPELWGSFFLLGLS